MAKCGIERIDSLIDNVEGNKPLSDKDTDAEAIGVVQELLMGFNYHLDVFNLKHKIRGTFENYTKIFVKRFRKRHHLKPETEIIVDHAALVKMIELSKVEDPKTSLEKNPIAGRIYLSRVLDFNFGGLLKCVWLTSMREGDGQFRRASDRRLNAVDRAGLSYGLLQWTHRFGNLSRIMERCNAKDPAALKGAFGEDNVTRMLAHAKNWKTELKGDGTSTIPQVEFLDDVWRKRFMLAASKRVFQKEQVQLALDDFAANLALFKSHEKDKPPLIKSERGIAFMLDLINQRPAWLSEIYDPAHELATTEAQLLQLIRDKAQFPERRDFFLKTKLLSDSDFVP